MCIVNYDQDNQSLELYACMDFTSYQAKVDQESCTLNVQDNLYLPKLEPFLESNQDEVTLCSKI